MGFFQHGGKAKKSAVQGISLDLLHRAGCQVCPLNHIAGNLNPHMPPSGSDHPLVYMLGEGPGEKEDRKGKPFVGNAGELLRWRVPKGWDRDLRWNNCVRTRPPENRDPSPVEIECCRPSVEKDVAESKPVAILGFGNIPLNWALRRGGITTWRGRRIPVRIGGHACWYYPIVHPSAILRVRHWDPRKLDDYPSDDEFAFAMDLRNAFREIDEGLPDPENWLITPEEAQEGCEFVTGEGGGADVDRILDFIGQCYEEPETGLDWETPCLRPYEEGAKILTCGLAIPKEALSFPLHHKGAKWTDAERKQVNTAVGDFVHDAPTRKISFQLPFEMEWAAFTYGKDCLWGSKWGDAQSQAYVLDGLRGKRGNQKEGEKEGGISLDFVCLQYFGFDLKAISNVDRKNLANTPVEDVCKYNALDAKFHLELWGSQWDRLEAEELVEVYEEQQRRAPSVVLSQLQGAPIDQKEAEAFKNSYEDKLADVEDKIDADPDAIKFARKYGHRYNPSKDASLMFRKFLGYRDLDDLQEATLSQLNEAIAQLTLDWRGLTKALSTYIYPCIEGHPRSNVYPDGLLHFIISICSTRTWRTASDSPNIQNWPKRDEDLKEIRKLLQAIKDRYLQDALGLGPDLYVVSFDYAGIQARNIAMESLDEGLIQAFWDRYNIHKEWMERIQRLHPKWADGKKLASDPKYMAGFRHSAKNKFVFPTFFGAQPKSVAPSLGVPLFIAEQLHEELFEQFPGVRTWQKELQHNYYQTGYVQGLSGFRRYAPVEWNQIINSPIQADEAIVVCDAYARLSEKGWREGLPQLQPMLEIHDDFTFMWPKKDIERNAEMVIPMMLDVPYKWAHCVPIEIEMSVGPNWGEMEEVGAYASDTWKGRLPDDHYKKLPR